MESGKKKNPFFFRFFSGLRFLKTEKKRIFFASVFSPFFVRFLSDFRQFLPNPFYFRFFSVFSFKKRNLTDKNRKNI